VSPIARSCSSTPSSASHSATCTGERACGQRFAGRTLRNGHRGGVSTGTPRGAHAAHAGAPHVGQQVAQLAAGARRLASRPRRLHGVFAALLLAGCLRHSARLPGVRVPVVRARVRARREAAPVLRRAEPWRQRRFLCPEVALRARVAGVHAVGVHTGGSGNGRARPSAASRRAQSGLAPEGALTRVQAASGPALPGGRPARA
jgi:hypothetical protein